MTSSDGDIVKQMSKAIEPASPISASDRAAAWRSLLFHVKQRRGCDRYVDLLLEWQAKTNLVSPSTLPNLWTRHISDSLQLLSLAPSAMIWVDLGSGGGFPGMVLACGLAETPGAIVHLVERNAKKAAFLREALRVTGRPAQSISLISGIVWIESRVRSIASPRARWLRYINSSASPNRWYDRVQKRCFSKAKM